MTKLLSMASNLKNSTDERTVAALTSVLVDAQSSLQRIGVIR